MSLQSNLSKQIIAKQKIDISSNTSIETTDVNLDLSIIQQQFAKDIVTESQNVTDAHLELLASKKSHTSGVASFDGVIEELFIKKGEFAVTGTPIMTLLEVGTLELEVSVPSNTLGKIRVGQKFVVGEEVVGYVSRFSPTILQGSVKVFIDVETSDFAPGHVLSGKLMIDSEDMSVAMVPRDYVLFSEKGPYVLGSDGIKILVAILHDAVSVMYIQSRSKDNLPKELLMNNEVRI